MINDRIIEDNLGLVYKMARKYSSCALEVGDLVQEGSFGLMKAAEKYDPSLGFRFSTYAMWWIRAAIQRAIKNTAHTMRIPVWLQDEVTEIEREQAAWYTEFGEQVSVEELSNMDAVLFQRAEKYLKQQQCGDIEDDFCIENRAGEHDVFQDVFNRQLQAHIDRALSTLDDRERYIIEKRYLNPGSEVSFRDLAKVFNITYQRAEQIEKEAFSKLRCELSI